MEVDTRERKQDFLMTKHRSQGADRPNNTWTSHIWDTFSTHMRCITYFWKQSQAPVCNLLMGVYSRCSWFALCDFSMVSKVFLRGADRWDFSTYTHVSAWPRLAPTWRGPCGGRDRPFQYNKFPSLSCLEAGDWFMMWQKAVNRCINRFYFLRHIKKMVSYTSPSRCERVGRLWPYFWPLQINLSLFKLIFKKTAN